MRCHRAHKIMARRAAQEISKRQERLLAEHLSICPDCAGLEDQLQSAWDTLESYPAVEPSADFLPHLKARLRSEQSATPRRRFVRPHLALQWMALAACALLIAVLFFRNGQVPRESIPQQAAVALVADHDRRDEQFLDDLERLLQSSDTDYLSAYDSWPAATQEIESPRPFPASPAERAKKKETPS